MPQRNVRDPQTGPAVSEIMRTTPPPPRRIRFEYKTVLDGELSDADFNALGAQGWQLVCFTGYDFIFQRPDGWVED